MASTHDADQQGAVSPERLAEEFELTQQAFFTDPEDQSAYIYHRWLLNESLAAFKQLDGTDKQAAAREVLDLINFHLMNIYFANPLGCNQW